MFKHSLLWLTLILSAYLTGCASVPMASVEDDQMRKTFTEPDQGMAGLYIYRNTNFGGALKKSLYIDGVLQGETGPMTYLYREISAGEHILSTESEFSDNDLKLTASGGNNYFVRQYIKLGLFVGGAGLELVTDDVGRQGVLECKLAR